MWIQKINNWFIRTFLGKNSFKTILLKTLDQTQESFIKES